MSSWKLIARVALAWTIGASVAAQPERPSAGDGAAQGQRLQARDGDVIVLENAAQVSVVRRKQARLRVVVNPSDASVIVLADHAFGPHPLDGIVDEGWRLNLTGGNWPIDVRWEGAGVVEELVGSGPGVMGVTLELPQGRIRFVPPGAPPVDASGYLTVLTYRSSAKSDGHGQTFDAAERDPSMAPLNAAGTGRSAATPAARGSVAPVRPGGDIPMPRKIRHVDPVMPDAARAARVLGIVVVELVIDADGAVERARVLRSIPLLDEAALTAARQWLYEPTLVNGQAVPALITATVEFKMQ